MFWPWVPEVPSSQACLHIYHVCARVLEMMAKHWHILFVAERPKFFRLLTYQYSLLLEQELVEMDGVGAVYLVSHSPNT